MTIGIPPPPRPEKDMGTSSFNHQTGRWDQRKKADPLTEKQTAQLRDSEKNEPLDNEVSEIFRRGTKHLGPR